MQANIQMTAVSEISVQHQQLLSTCKIEKHLNQLLGGPPKPDTADIHHPKEILTYTDDRCQIFILYVFKHSFEVLLKILTILSPCL